MLISPFCPFVFSFRFAFVVLSNAPKRESGARPTHLAILSIPIVFLCQFSLLFSTFRRALPVRAALICNTAFKTLKNFVGRNCFQNFARGFTGPGAVRIGWGARKLVSKHHVANLKSVVGFTYLPRVIDPVLKCCEIDRSICAGAGNSNPRIEQIVSCFSQSLLAWISKLLL